MIKEVFSFRYDGLGARLFAMANGVRIANLLGVPFRFIWMGREDVGSIKNPYYLFDHHTMIRNGVHMGGISLMLNGETTVTISSDAYLPIIDREVFCNAHRGVILCSRLSRFKDEKPEDAKAGLKAAFDKILPNAQIATVVNDFAASTGLSGAVGVHVRRGDVVNHKREIDRVRAIELDRYFEVLDVMDSQRKIFLCTEDPAVFQEFFNRYGERVFSYPCRALDRTTVEAIEDAYTEMILLSKTDFVMGGLSAFNRVASGMGGRALIRLDNDPALRTDRFLRAGNVLVDRKEFSGARKLAEMANCNSDLPQYKRIMARSKGKG